MAYQVTRSFANRAFLGRWEGNCSRRDTGELTAQMQRLWQDLPQGVISDLIESMPRRISACIAARDLTISSNHAEVKGLKKAEIEWSLNPYTTNRRKLAPIRFPNKKFEAFITSAKLSRIEQTEYEMVLNSTA
ncbi:hypothetical protein TNCV_4720491 [Trichonephila clavipes]|uniref:Uncharacterized protein n=1 Tax=Trichonephila clavipes TaxID=2585209 RepID=A0A8X6W623_TRICX|nr:hypothetical protein TNCV_4720491 [Trichonephila clavipes]